MSSEIRAKLQELRCKVGDHQMIEARKAKYKRDIIELMHEYNDVKDAAQIVLGVLSIRNECTIKEMHLKYNLPLNDG